jgi:hypothetical protein
MRGRTAAHGFDRVPRDALLPSVSKDSPASDRTRAVRAKTTAPPTVAPTAKPLSFISADTNPAPVESNEIHHPLTWGSAATVETTIGGTVPFSRFWDPHRARCPPFPSRQCSVDSAEALAKSPAISILATIMPTRPRAATSRNRIGNALPPPTPSTPRVVPSTSATPAPQSSGWPGSGSGRTVSPNAINRRPTS